MLIFLTMLFSQPGSGSGYQSTISVDRVVSIPDPSYPDASGLGDPGTGTAYLIDNSGAYLVDSNGAYLIGAA